MAPLTHTAVVDEVDATVGEHMGAVTAGPLSVIAFR